MIVKIKYFLYLFGHCSELEARLSDFNFKQEQKWGQIRNHIKNIKARLSPEILAMTIGEMQDLLKQGIKTYEQAEEITSKNSAPLKNITNKTLNSYIHMSAKASKTDDGKSLILFFLYLSNSYWSS